MHQMLFPIHNNYGGIALLYLLKEAIRWLTARSAPRIGEPACRAIYCRKAPFLLHTAVGQWGRPALRRAIQASQ